MFADIDHHHPDVRQELFGWAEWLDSELRIGGLRLDAVKHYSWHFVRDMLAHVDDARSRRLGDGAKPWLVVGEYSGDDREPMEKYLELLQGRVSLFDFPLLLNFCRASYDPNVDLRTIFAGALCETRPNNAVAFVMNHDTVCGGLALAGGLLLAGPDMLTPTRSNPVKQSRCAQNITAELSLRC